MGTHSDGKITRQAGSWKLTSSQCSTCPASCGREWSLQLRVVYNSSELRRLTAQASRAISRRSAEAGWWIHRVSRSLVDRNPWQFRLLARSSETLGQSSGTCPRWTWWLRPRTGRLRREQEKAKCARKSRPDLLHAKHHIARIPHELHHKLFDPLCEEAFCDRHATQYAAETWLLCDRHRTCCTAPAWRCPVQSPGSPEGQLFACPHKQETLWSRSCKARTHTTRNHRDPRFCLPLSAALDSNTNGIRRNLM